MSLSKCADYWNTIATWMPRGTVGHGFARQAIPMTWDFVEANPLADFHCAWHEAFKWTAAVCEAEAASHSHAGQSSLRSATAQSLPDESAQAVVTDPPYYDAVPYAHLSDFFYVWLRRSLGGLHIDDLRDTVVPKDEEIVVDRPHQLSTSVKDISFYECELTKAFAESRRVLRPDGIATIVFASKTTASWEAILRAVVDAGWIITGSWPIDTERQARLAPKDKRGSPPPSISFVARASILMIPCSQTKSATGEMCCKNCRNESMSGCPGSRVRVLWAPTQSSLASVPR